MEVKDSLDEKYYNRQIEILGEEGSRNLASSTVLIIGLGGIGAEIAKNLIVTGVKNIELFDDSICGMDDLSSQFCLNENDIGRRRDESSLRYLSRLNPNTTIKIHETFDMSILNHQTCLIYTRGNLGDAIHINIKCHELNINFLFIDNKGVICRIFSDFIQFKTTNKNGEVIKPLLIDSITNGVDGNISFYDDRQHHLDEGDEILFRDIIGMTELNGTIRSVHVIDKKTISIGDTSGYHTYIGGGCLYRILPEYVIHDITLDQAINNENLIENRHMGYTLLLHHIFKSIDEFMSSHDNSLPNYEDVNCIIELMNKFYQLGDNDITIIKLIIRSISGNMSSFTSMVGGICTQEVIKVCCHLYTPLHQIAYYDCISVIPDISTDLSEFIPMNCRYDGEILIMGRSLLNTIRTHRLMVVGCSEITSELMKIFGLNGLSTNNDGIISLVDDGTVNKYDVSTNMLFTPDDTDMEKVEVLKSNSLAINKLLHVDSKFMNINNTNGLDYSNYSGIVTNTSDYQSRHSQDIRGVQNSIPLYDGGYSYNKGSTQVVIPHLTQSYSDSHDMPEEGFLLCAIKNFPYLKEHTIVRAKEIFEEEFIEIPQLINSYISDQRFIDTTLKEPATSHDKIYSLHYNLTNKPISFEQCISYAVELFYHSFYYTIKEMLSNFPANHKDENGNPFWHGRKRVPTPIELDINNDVHMQFILNVSIIRAQIFGLTPIFENDWMSKLPAIHHSPRLNSKSYPPIDELLSQLPDRNTLSGYKCQIISYKPDSDLHINAIFTISHIRATSYEIDPPSRLYTQYYGGQILPCMIQIASILAGNIMQQIYTYIQMKSIDYYHNLYINTNTNYFILYQPLECSTILYKHFKWTKWSRIDIKNTMTLREIIDYFHSEYDVTVSILTHGVAMLYSDFSRPNVLKERYPLKIEDLYTLITKQPYQHNSILYLDVTPEDDNIVLPQIRYFIQ